MPACRFCDHDNPPGASRCAGCGASLDTGGEAGDASSVAVADEQIRELLAKGRKIEGIQLYRQQTGAGLRVAKEAVEALERGEARGKFQRSGRGLELDVLAALEQGNKIQAIKLYRDRTGAGLRESKDAVEALAARHGVSQKGAGCLGVIVLAATSGLMVIRLFS